MPDNNNVEASHLRDRFNQERYVADQLRNCINEISAIVQQPTDSPEMSLEAIKDILNYYKIP